MKQPLLFYLPRINLLFVRLIQIVVLYIGRWLFKFELIVSPESLAKIKSLGHKTLLLTANHPTFQDPIVVFILSAKLNLAFHYLAAYELFNGSLSWFFQRLGVYSIRRGLVDRASISQTLKLLSNPDCRLVVFPEGGCSFQNDTVMPFRSGTVQLAFKAIDKQVKQGKNVPDLYVIPLSIKYKYTQDMSKAISNTLENLEQALNITPDKDFSNYQRLRTISKQVIIKIEQDYELSTQKTEQISVEERINQLRNKIIADCEQQLEIKTNPQEMVRERTYKLQNALKIIVDRLESPDNISEKKSTRTESNLDLYLIDKSVKRLLNFDAIYDGYVAENPTPERFLDTLIRLEREVFDIDQPKPKGFRQAIVKVGEPLNLKNFYNTYQQNQLPEIEQITQHIQQQTQQLLY